VSGSDSQAPANGGKDPWTDPDPQPGDFDSELDRTRPDQVEIHEGHSVLAGHEQRRQAIDYERSVDDRSELERFSANASRSVLRHMTEDEEQVDISWEEFRSQ